MAADVSASGPWMWVERSSSDVPPTSMPHHARRHVVPCLLAIVKTVYQCLCSFEIVSFETLGEPTVDREQGQVLRARRNLYEIRTTR